MTPALNGVLYSDLLLPYKFLGYGGAIHLRLGVVRRHSERCEAQDITTDLKKSEGVAAESFGLISDSDMSVGLQ